MMNEDALDELESDIDENENERVVEPKVVLIGRHKYARSTNIFKHKMSAYVGRNPVTNRTY